jgi:hypothetical protein
MVSPSALLIVKETLKGNTHVNLTRLEAWLSLPNSSAPALLTNKREFVLIDEERTTEYVSPFDSEVRLSARWLSHLIIATTMARINAV